MRKITLVGCVLLLCAVMALGIVGCSKGEYVGSTMSNKYHDPSCMWVDELPKDRQVWFDTVEEAEAAGYVPCSTCLDGE